MPYRWEDDARPDGDGEEQAEAQADERADRTIPDEPECHGPEGGPQFPA